MKLTFALSILGLTQLPATEEDLNLVYRDLAKIKHPDVGGSEKEFKELQEARDYLKKAMIVVNFAKKPISAEDELIKKKREALKAEMLKRRAKEDYKRNLQGTWGIAVITFVVALIVFAAAMRPSFIQWMVSRSPVERMATVVHSDQVSQFIIQWEYNNEKVIKTVNGRFVEGRWLLGDAGMPILKGSEFIVVFNASNPDYFLLKDHFISPQTAEVYFHVLKYPLAEILDVSSDDSEVVCLYWAILDEFGVDGLAHVLFSQTPLRKNWSHNERTFRAFHESEDFIKLYRSCSP